MQVILWQMKSDTDKKVLEKDNRISNKNFVLKNSRSAQYL